MKRTPRPYQSAFLEALRRAVASLPSSQRRVLGVGPTGMGKSTCGAMILEGAARLGTRCVVLVHTTELVEQWVALLEQCELPHGVLKAGWPETPEALLQVASIDTYVRRAAAGRVLPAKLLLIDEAHLHVGTARVERALEANPGADVVGLSASPWRLDGRPMGNVYRSLVIAAQPSELIAQGWLVAPRVFAPGAPDLEGVASRDGDFAPGQLAVACDKPKLVGDIVETWGRLGRVDGHSRLTLVFATSRAHSQHLRDAFRGAGVAAEHIDGTLPRAARRTLVSAFRADSPDGTRVLCGVDTITTGLDVPAVSCLVVARPTQSEALWVQIGGRVMRTAPGKTGAVIADHAGNTLRLGYPHADRAWGLTREDVARPAAPRTLTLRTCLSCFAVLPAGTAVCSECGAVFPVEAREVATAAGDLHEVTRAATPEEKRAEFARLCGVALKRGLPREWVSREFKRAFDVWPRLPWPEGVRPRQRDLAQERERLERIAFENGYQRGWVEQRLAAIAAKMEAA